jgi:hypothetical protein
VQHSDSMAEILRITRTASIFDDVANLLVSRVRAAMRVPSNADAETEAQLARLREKLDVHFPEFRATYAALLAAHLRADAASVAEALRNPLLQSFFVASPAIARELSVELPQLAAEMVKSVSGNAANQAAASAG